MWVYAGVYGILILIFLRVRNKNLSNTSKMKLVYKVFLIMVCVVTVSFLTDLSEIRKDGDGQASKIERRSYGQGSKKEKVIAKVEGEEPKEMEIEVSSREYKKSELKKLFHRAEEELDRLIPGKNKSFSHVDRSLVLPEQLEGFPFRIYWELSRYDVMDMSGKLQKDQIEKEDPSGEGIPVEIRGILSYEGQESVYDREVVLFVPKSEKKNIHEQLQDRIEDLDKEQIDRAHLDLPQEIQGKKVSWEKASDSSLPSFVLYGLMISLCLLLVEKERAQKQYINKKEKMLHDYPQIVSQFTLLMEAGMNAKNVWKKIVEDYEVRKSLTGEKRDAYEEMLYTWQEMRSGIPEVECYERFARRSDSAQYRKLGMLLAQNLKKGSRGVAHILYMESFQMMEEAKSQIRMAGEKAGTKLLGPMLMMLFVVMLIVVIPAFLSIHI